MRILVNIAAIVLCATISSYAQSFIRVSESEYYRMRELYAEAITTNIYPELASFHGELGEDDEFLQVFLLEKREGVVHILVKQGDLLDEDTLNFYSVTIPETVCLFVYSIKYTSPLLLYHSPDEQYIKEQCDAFIANPLRIKDVYKTWLKVQFEESGKKHEGWIPSKEYCSNPYSTCS